MKLQKLAFFSQGWSLGLRHKALFDEEFEAWINGPVAYDLFNIHRGDWTIESWRHGDASKLTARERAIVDAVLRNYGALSGKELSDLTHQPGTPWHQVRTQHGLNPKQRTKQVIGHEVIEAYFAKTLN
jgi:uncharacterized phage-associated protein